LKPVRKYVWAAVIFFTIAIAVLAGFWARPLSYFDRLTAFQMWMGGARSHEITVAGRRIHYYVQGPAAGSPVVLVHGLGGRCEDWRNLAPFIARAGFRVYMPDLPGFGRSEKPSDFSYSMPDQAAAVVGIMDALELKQVDLGGWSMGGWIVQRVAADHPDRIKRLMLFDSAGIYEPPAWDTKLFTPTSAAELDQLDVLLMPHPPQVPGFIATDILRVSRQNGWIVQRAMASMLAGHDATDSLLPQLKMPVLIVWGGLDHITPLSQGEKMHGLIPQSRLEVFPACGHLAPVQCADQIGPKVEAFLK
jgi:pimeloyl-ACP methyl ester carboxylesterase